MKQRVVPRVAAAAVTLWMVLAFPAASRSQTQDSSGRQDSALEILLDLVAGLRQPSNGETRLLFPSVDINTELPGYTEIRIVNTGRDPYGTQGVTGACDVHFYGTVEGIHGAETTRTVPAIEPGRNLFWSLGLGFVSTGGPSSLIEPLTQFHGYAIATCAFPLAHGQMTQSPDGATVFPPLQALILPSTRSTSFIETRGH